MREKLRQGRRALAAFLPAVGLVLMPKCPLCLAAWLTMATGLSISVAHVAWLRGGLVLFLIGGLLWQLKSRRLSM